MNNKDSTNINETLENWTQACLISCEEEISITPPQRALSNNIDEKDYYNATTDERIDLIGNSNIISLVLNPRKENTIEVVIKDALYYPVCTKNAIRVRAKQIILEHSLGFADIIIRFMVRDHTESEYQPFQKVVKIIYKNLFNDEDDLLKKVFLSFGEGVYNE